MMESSNIRSLEHTTFFLVIYQCDFLFSNKRIFIKAIDQKGHYTAETFNIIRDHLKNLI